LFQDRVLIKNGYDKSNHGFTGIVLPEKFRQLYLLTLRVNVGDIQAAFDRLINSGGRALHEVQRTPALELEAHVANPDGNAVIIWRELSEDEHARYKVAATFGAPCDHPVFVSNAAHGGLDRRFLKSFY